MQDIGEKERKYMKKKIIYTDEPIHSRKTKDFLPSPEFFILKKEDKKRVTIELSDSSINFFKKVAEKQKASYQVMIRRLLDYYVDKQQNSGNFSKFANA